MEKQKETKDRNFLGQQKLESTKLISSFMTTSTQLRKQKR